MKGRSIRYSARCLFVARELCWPVSGVPYKAIITSGLKQPEGTATNRRARDRGCDEESVKVAMKEERASAEMTTRGTQPWGQKGAPMPAHDITN